LRRACGSGCLGSDNLDREEPDVHFVLLAEHDADVCPTSNAKTRDLLLQTGAEIPNIAQRNGVTIVAGPFVNREHVVVAVVEAEKADAVDAFVVQSRLQQWNRVRVIPSHTIEEGMAEIAGTTTLF
jgi:hypothetical protein